METTILLAKVLGIYMTVAGLVVLFRNQHYLTALRAVAESQATRFFVGIFAFIASIFYVLAQRDWSSFPAGLVTFMGWALLIKSLCYINLSNAQVGRWVEKLGRNGRSKIAGAVALVAGVYLLNFGFGMY